MRLASIAGMVVVVSVVGGLQAGTPRPAASAQSADIARSPAQVGPLLRILRALVRPTNLNEGEEQELRQMAAAQIAWGEDDAASNPWVGDGECDDGRFGNAPGVDDAVGASSLIRRDATDCRRLFLNGKIRVLDEPRR